ncbi:putative ribonuclease H-like domain-containing protein, partial [Tanacetum coccineum]
MSHSHPKGTFVPKAVLMKSGLKTLNTARQNSSRAAGNVTTVGPKAVVSDSKENKANAVKASTCWVWRPKQKKFRPCNPQLELQEKGVIDSGCSRYMTGNMSYLSDYKEINGGYVAFGGDPKRGKITGKGKIRTGKLDIKDVHFVKELKFNLFSVLQMCDKKNSVLFTDTECVVLSPDFKLIDESHVLLKVPRKDNMYSIDLKNVVPQGGLTCLIAKATLDEYNLWHKWLGHINFKTMNILSIMKKMYYLVVTDDYSRFSWVFFLATKDKTSGIFKAFIRGIENQINHRVKIIRCDNGTEFKNMEMNRFCVMKRIKREFSIARTPQQNEVAERKNRTLIEAAKTMLADLKLPTTFWAEAVNTACYVQNMVLVIKPHNKTSYELFLCRKLALSFMRPFGYPVTILNTLDHLGKFDGKADEGFFIGYYVNIVAGNQYNGRAGTKACDNASKVRLEIVPGKDYILLPLWTQYPPLSSSLKDSLDVGFKPSGEEEKKDDEYPKNEDSKVR